MEFKWYTLMVLGVALSIAISFASVQFANAPVAVACVEAGGSWVTVRSNAECHAKDYVEEGLSK